jgi:4-amino-4-deoxy-L-arabinose transferase-like glycosyltransferase
MSTVDAPQAAVLAPKAPASTANVTVADWAGAVLRSPALWLVLLAVGLVARCRQYLGCPSFWYDEAYLLINIYDCSFAELIGPLRAEVVIPPFFLWLLRGLYLLLGPGELPMRLPAMVAGVAALFALAALARRVVGRPAWLWVVALCAVSQHALIHSYEVRPYTCDLLVSTLILLAAAVVLDRYSGPRARAGARVGLLAAAALAPWLSFPSAFVLAGASLALLPAALLGRRDLWKPWLALNGLLLVSGALLWYVSARHLYYTGLREHWGQRFPDLARPLHALGWLGGALNELGDYGTSGMGVPLLVLGGLGLVSLWRRQRPLALLLVGPVATGILAAALRRYPFGDRLLLYAVPCLWLLAAEGLAASARWRGGRLAWLALTALVVMVLPEAARMVKHAVVLAPRAEFREAFAYVHAQEQPGDVLWTAFPEVHEVYYGKDHPCLSLETSPEELARALLGRRVWAVVPERGWLERCFPKAARQLATVQPRPSAQGEFRYLQVLLYDPAQTAGRRRTMNPE